MTLTMLILIPLLGAGCVLLMADSARLARTVAVLFGLLTLAAALFAASRYDLADGGYQLVEKHHWITPLGTWYALGLNGIGLALVLLTAILVPVVILAGSYEKHRSDKAAATYLAWMLVLEGLAMGVFCATDAFLFYVLFESTLVPLYFLIGSHGSDTGTGRGQRSYAAVKFLIYNLVGGLLMLAAVVALGTISSDQGTVSFLLSDLQHLHLSDTTERLLFCGFFAAFAVKAPLWPFHTWLPDAAASSTPGTAVLMVSIVDKLGTFGMIRWCLELFPGASDWASPVVIVLALISVIYGALLAIGQDDLRRLIAFTSVSHFGFIVLGIFAFTTVSTSGSVLYMFNHGLSTAALFLVTGMMIARRGSASIADYGGVQKIAPVLSGFLLVAGLSSLSLPGLAPFVSEFMVLAGTFTTSVIAAAIATLGIVLAALYILVMYQRTMTGPLNHEAAAVHDLRPAEVAALAPLLVLIIGLGFFPQPMLDLINPAVDSVTHIVGIGDPAPKTPVNLSAEGGH
jgi:NADH-quinone oxidoreductase subunit M